MKRFAVISGNSVINVIAADTLENAKIGARNKCVEIPDGLNVDTNWQLIDDEFVDVSVVNETLAE